MAVIARAQCTLAVAVDVASVDTWYKLQASTSAAPSKPTTASPSDWSTTEPGYDGTTTNTLYACQKTTLTDGTYYWGAVCVSSSYEAAKQAANAAGAAQGTAVVAAESANAAASDARDAQSAADAAQGAADEAQSAADAAQATAEDAQATAQDTREHFWADAGGAHVGTVENSAHTSGAGYNMTLGATGTAVGIVLDHDDETLASFTQSALNFYADGQTAASYTKDGVGLYAQDSNDTAQQVAAFTRSGITFFDGTGNSDQNVVASFGSGGAIIGASGGKRVSITDENLAFVDGDEVVASVDGQALVIARATINEALSLGGFAWIPRSNNNLALKWMG